VAEITYLPEVECAVAVENGLFDSQVVSVPDEKDDKQFLRVGRGQVTTDGSKTYLPVAVVYLDTKGKRALVELPQEADSGTRRLWVPFARFRPQEAP